MQGARRVPDAGVLEQYVEDGIRAQRSSRAVITLRSRWLGGVEDRRGARPTGSRPFPIPAHQTGRADFPHPASRLASSPSTRQRPQVDTTKPDYSHLVMHNLI